MKNKCTVSTPLSVIKPPTRKDPSQEKCKGIAARGRGRPKLGLEVNVKKKEGALLEARRFKEAIKKKNKKLVVKIKDVSEVLMRQGIPKYQSGYQNV